MCRAGKIKLRFDTYFSGKNQLQKDRQGIGVYDIELSAHLDKNDGSSSKASPDSIWSSTQISRYDEKSPFASSNLRYSASDDMLK